MCDDEAYHDLDESLDVPSCPPVIVAALDTTSTHQSSSEPIFHSTEHSLPDSRS